MLECEIFAVTYARDFRVGSPPRRHATYMIDINIDFM